jgi:hypothetical protein
VIFGNENECWPWVGTTYSNGYGKFSEGKKPFYAHRVAWEMVNDVSIPTGRVIRHSCDNPRCVNPLHLSEGTQIDNIRDMDERGRRAKGEARSKLTEIQAKEIISLRGVVSPSILAGRYDVNQNTIRGIQAGRNWSYLHANKEGG